MRWIGIDLDEGANTAGRETISSAASAVTVLVIKTDEERMIAEHSADVAGMSAPAQAGSDRCRRQPSV
jgi:acetate kinase